MTLQGDNFALWAHRGRRQASPENTAVAFETSLKAGDFGIELDVQVSADNHMVVIHDASVERTTNGKGEVAHMSLAELQRLDAGCWFDKGFAGERIPLLSDVLRAAKAHCWVNVEIKFEKEIGNRDREIHFLDTINRCGDKDSIIISCFNWSVLESVRSLDNSIRIGVLAKAGDAVDDVMAVASKVGAFSIHPPLEHVLGGCFSKSSEALNFKIYPYTIRNKDELEAVKERGMDGCFADLPFER